MERYPCLCLEIYKRMNYLNSGFVTDNFKLSDLKKSVQKQNVLNLNITRPSQVSYGEKRLRVLGPKIQNNLPAHVKSAPNPLSFMGLIKCCDVVS